MAKSIVLDAGHGGRDNGAVYEDMIEKNDNLRIVLALGQELENRGINVYYTRTTDVFQTPFEKAQIANEADGDFFISFHRNSSPRANQYSGVETLLYDLSGDKLEMAENINGALGELGFHNLGVHARPGLVVLRKTRMPALLIETGFINTEEDNARFDQQFDEIAQAIAYAILGSLEEEEIQEESAETSPLYRVQVGLFREKQNADNLLYELQDMGYPAFLLQEDGFYKVQVGAFRILSNAIKMEQRLRQDGFSTWITTR